MNLLNINTGAKVKDVTQDNIKEKYVLYFINRCAQLFEWDGLPENIPQKFLELYLQTSGSVGIIESGGKLWACAGSFAGVPNGYYIPREYIITNPYIPYEGNPVIGEGVAVGYNDTTATGLMPLIRKYSELLAVNEVSMNIASINKRAMAIISASDNATLQSAEIYYKRLEEGKPATIGENSFLEGLKIQPMASTNTNLKDLIELEQYFKASFFQELGINANYNMKREAIGAGESALNDDALRPLIDDMLKRREELAEEINRMYGLNVSVTLGSIWKENKEEAEAELEAMQREAETQQEAQNEPQADEEEQPEAEHSESEEEPENDGKEEKE